MLERKGNSDAGRRRFARDPWQCGFGCRDLAGFRESPTAVVPGDSRAVIGGADPSVVVARAGQLLVPVDGRSFATDGQMRNLGSQHLFFFPGYPFLIAPLFWVSDKPIWLLSAFQWLCAIGFMVGVYWWAKSVVPQWAVWIAALSVLNEGVWIYCARPLTEISFMCGLIWSTHALLAASRSRSWSAAIGWGSLAAALLALTSLIRPAGIVLAAGFGLHLAWKAISHELSWVRVIALTLLCGIPGSLAIVGFLRSETATAAAE